MKIVISAFKATYKEKPLWVVTLFVAIIAGTLIQLLPPQLLKIIIDKHIEPGYLEGIWNLAFLYLMVVILGGVFDFFREFTIALVGENMLAEIRLKMAAKLSKLPISYFNRNAHGTIISYLTSDVEAVGTLITTGVIGMLADVLKALGIMISLFVLSPILALYAVSLIPIIYFITKGFKGATLKAQMETRKALGKINGSIQEIFNGIQTIKLFNKEEYFLSLFQEPLNENITAVNKTSTFDSIFPCIMQVLRALFITTIVMLVAPNGIGQLTTLSLGALAASIELISKLLAPIEAIAMEFQTIQEAVAGLKRIEEFYSLKEETREFYNSYEKEFQKLEGTIRVEGVSFSYEESKTILNNVSFNLKSGQKMAIAGRTGAGKSTLMNIISGLYKPKEGKITIGGLDPFLIPPKERRRLIGIVPQSFTIYDGTVREAITLFDEDIKEEEIIFAAKTVELHEKIMSLEKGYETLLGEGEQQLSNGEYQLLSLACAIVCNPPVLLLDEMTSGLDAITEEKIYKALKKICKGRTLITISHRVSGIIDADEALILKDGEIVEKGDPSELLKKEGWYKSFNEMENLGWRI